jgi:hypothetical protein
MNEKKENYIFLAKILLPCSCFFSSKNVFFYWNNDFLYKNLALFEKQISIKKKKQEQNHAVIIVTRG